MKINTVNRDWDKKKGCCADGCPPNLHKWWLYHRGRTQQWHWDCSDVRRAIGSPRMVACGEKTTVPCIDRLIRCAIVGKRTGEESRKKPAYQKWCRPFGPDIRDTNSHSVTDINRNWNKRGTCDRRRRRRRRRLK